MAEKILMTALSPTMETGTIVKWLKKEGDSVQSGDLLCEVETDKATMDYESTNDGTLLKIIADEGSEVKVGEIIAITGNRDEDISELIKPQEETVYTPPQEAAPEQEVVEKKTKKTAPSSRIKASPLAREIARQENIDLSLIKGSGPEGRIVKSDIEKFTQKKRESIGKPEPQKETKTFVNQKQQVIAQRLSGSMFSAPHFYLTVSVNMKTVVDARKRLIKKLNSKISFNAFLIKFVAETIKHYPNFNSTWEDNSIIRHGSIDIGLATAQEDGLITPVVRDCESKGIIAINEELQDLIPRARESKLLPEEYSDATFTISNLGSFGVRQFTAIINPPGSAILAVGEILKEKFIDEQNSIDERQTCLMTLSCDHRVIYGAEAADFANHLRNLIENPVSALYA
jgi:pyruvate dehydrogenase E2 component (dihydrolipoamide acetyltransferase)